MPAERKSAGRERPPSPSKASRNCILPSSRSFLTGCRPGLLRWRRVGKIHATDIKTMPHPGFPTDMQQPFAALLALADGVSMITETVYESRFRYTTELARMGADIRVEDRTAVIHGVDRLTGAPVTCTDLRGGAAVVVAGLAAEGETEISGLEHLDRGYEGIVPK